MSLPNVTSYVPSLTRVDADAPRARARDPSGLTTANRACSWLASRPSTESALRNWTLPVALASRMNGVASPEPDVCSRKPWLPRVRNAAANPLPLLTMFRHGSAALFELQTSALAPPSPVRVLRAGPASRGVSAGDP